MEPIGLLFEEKYGIRMVRLNSVLAHSQVRTLRDRRRKDATQRNPFLYLTLLVLALAYSFSYALALVLHRGIFSMESELIKDRSLFWIQFCFYGAFGFGGSLFSLVYLTIEFYIDALLKGEKVPFLKQITLLKGKKFVTENETKVSLASSKPFSLASSGFKLTAERDAPPVGWPSEGYYTLFRRLDGKTSWIVRSGSWVRGIFDGRVTVIDPTVRKYLKLAGLIGYEAILLFISFTLWSWELFHFDVFSHLYFLVHNVWRIL